MLQTFYHAKLALMKEQMPATLTSFWKRRDIFMSKECVKAIILKWRTLLE